MNETERESEKSRREAKLIKSKRRKQVINKGKTENICKNNKLNKSRFLRRIM